MFPESLNMFKVSPC